VVARVAFILLLVGVTAVVAPSAVGQANGVSCGQVVTSDVILTESLTDCPTAGLLVGADGITIDLNGYTIAGQGLAGSVGVGAGERLGITIKNGHIRGFDLGISLYQTGGSTFSDLKISDTTIGIRSDGSGHPRPPENRFEGNKISDSETGILIRGEVPSLVVANRIVGLAGTGIHLREVSNAGLRVERNVVSKNGGSGIIAFNSHAVFVGNTTDANGGDGLSIYDDISTHGPAHMVADHRANRNGGLGITATTIFPLGVIDVMEGVVDGGGNRATNNGDPRECLGVLCG
jgi:parallel beta helix pectate lyase-like protein